jgi:hypothetical protein
LGISGQWVARTAEAYGSISENASVSHPALSSPRSSPPTPEKVLKWVSP